MSERTHAPQRRTLLFDYLIGSCKQFIWDGESKRLGGLEIDDQLKLCRHLHRKVGRLLALKDAVDIPCRLAAPAANWHEAAEKARYLLNLFAATLAAQDPRRQTLIAAVLADFARLSGES